MNSSPARTRLARALAWLKGAISAIFFGVLGNISFQQLQTLDPSPLRDATLILIWPLTIVAAVAVVWLVRDRAAGPAEETRILGQHRRV